MDSQSAAPPPLPPVMQTADPTKILDRLPERLKALQEAVSSVVVGRSAEAEAIFLALLSRGHCLLVGAPGLAKTLLVNAVAKLLDLPFSRIQFTPDLMPADIIGTEILEEDTASGHRNFIFAPGPVFTNVLLADEINRTPPKTQAALLEAMQEGRCHGRRQTYAAS